jgi:hypothetical protein
LVYFFPFEPENLATLLLSISNRLN